MPPRALKTVDELGSLRRAESDVAGGSSSPQGLLHSGSIALRCLRVLSSSVGFYGPSRSSLPVHPTSAEQAEEGGDEGSLAARASLLFRNTKPHWLQDDDNFRRAEGERRRRNEELCAAESMDNNWTHTHLFFSHCWRGLETQERKRMLFSALTEEGAILWSDFLDLQAQGPIPWRNEIGTAIQACSKFIAMIDKQYLLSFNCLEELENAIHWHKPLVLCMLDQTAWNLLTTLGGHREAWEEEPASGGYPLSRFEGQSFGPLRVRFSLERVERIFNTLASINFCPCRELDFANMGAASVAERLNEFVAKDLGYTKEHAFLQSRAEAWCAAERPNGFLLEGRTDVQKWTDWIKMATRAGFFPTPTREQQEYVKASSRRHLRRLNFQKSAGVSLVVLIFLLMVASSALACWAIRQRNLVAQQRELAVWQQRVATSLALSSELRPQLSSQARGMLRAAEIAESIGFPALMLPALTSTVNYLTSLRYWFLDLDAHRDRVTGVAFSPDGRWVASGSEDHTVRIRELPPYRSEAVGVEMLPPFRHSRELRCQGGVVSVAWSPSGDLVAAGCREASEGEPPAVFVWRVDPRAGCWGEAHRLNMTGPSSAKGLAWSHDGELLAAGSDQAIVVWRIGETERSAGPPEALKLQRGRWSGQVKARSLAWHPGRYLLAAGGTDTYLAVWDIDGVVAGIPSPVAAAWFGNIDINAVAFSGDGRLLASGDDYRQVLIWDMERVSVTAGGEGDGEVQELKLKHRLPRHGDVVSGLAWSAAGDLASCSHDGTVRLYRFLHRGTAEESLYIDHVLTNPSRILTSIAYSPGQPETFVAGTWANTVRGWQVAGAIGRRGPEFFKMNCTTEAMDAYGELFTVRGASWTRDGEAFAASSYEGAVCVWERDGDGWTTSATLRPERLPDEGRFPPSRVVLFSPSGELLAAGSDSGSIGLWRRLSGGEWVAEKDRTGQGMNNTPSSVDDLAWSWDSRWLAAARGNLLKVWDVESHDPSPTTLEGHNGTVLAAAWRHEGVKFGCAILASGSSDTTIRIWELCLVPVRAEDGGRAMTGTHITSIYDHRHHIRALEWSGFGLLASSGKDSRVLIHAFEDGVASLSIELSGHNGEVWGVSWAPDGSQLATAANDNSVRVWDITRDQAKQSRKYTMWHMRKKCRYLRWLNVEPQRLACARDSVSLESPNTMSEEPPFTYWMEYTLMDYRYQAEVLRGLTYGYLTQDDLRSLGCDSIALTVMDPALSNQAAAAEGETMAWNSTEWKPDGACRP